MRFFRSLLSILLLCCACFADSVPAAPRADNLDDLGGRNTPLSLRGNAPQFPRTVTACLFRGNEWMLPHQLPMDAVAVLEELNPSFVIGTIFLEADQPVSEKTATVLQEIRFRLQSGNGVTGFDLTLDLRSFTTKESLIAFMRGTMSKLTMECWTFIGMEEILRSRPELAEAAKAEARAHGMAVGAVITGADAIADLDYAVVSYDDGDRLAERVQRAGTGRNAKNKRIRIPVLVRPGTENLLSGNAFALNKTPAQRRRMVTKAAEQQGGNVWFAYPVFGPSADTDRSYDALRDEFMMDTVKRCMAAFNPAMPALPITIMSPAKEK